MNIEELLNKLDAQNFGPKDSVIASTINHPINGISKLLEYLDSNVKGVNDPYLSSGQQSEHATNLAGLMQTGALPFAPKSSGGTLGSLTWLPKEHLEHVKHLNDDRLWDATGAFRYGDEFIKEIPDTNAKFIKDIKYIPDKQNPLFSVLSHDKIYSAEPSIADIDTMYKPSAKVGSYDGNIIFTGEDDEYALQNLLHEITHAQAYKGGSKYLGTNASDAGIYNPSNLIKSIEQYINHSKDETGNIPYYDRLRELTSGSHSRVSQELYQSNPGEVLARMVGQRFDYSPEDLRIESPIETMRRMGYDMPTIDWQQLY